MGSIRGFFRVIGIVWLVAILAIGIGGTYLEHHPEAAAGFALGAMNVDRDAGPIEQARQFGEGAAVGHALAAERRFAEKSREPKSVAEQWSRDRAEDEADQARRDQLRDRYSGY